MQLFYARHINDAILFKFVDTCTFKRLGKLFYRIEHSRGSTIAHLSALSFNEFNEIIIVSYMKIIMLLCFQMISTLGITPRDARQSFIDMAYSLIEGGFVKKTRKYQGPPSVNNSPSEMWLNKKNPRDNRESNAQQLKCSLFLTRKLCLLQCIKSLAVWIAVRLKWIMATKNMISDAQSYVLWGLILVFGQFKTSSMRNKRDRFIFCRMQFLPNWTIF